MIMAKGGHIETEEDTIHAIFGSFGLRSIEKH
jgi:hypothetical protein